MGWTFVVNPAPSCFSSNLWIDQVLLFVEVALYDFVEGGLSVLERLRKHSRVVELSALADEGHRQPFS